MNYKKTLKNISFFILFLSISMGASLSVFGESLEEAKQHFSSKFSPLKETVLDAGGFFSMSEMTKDLSDLFPLATRIGKNSQELLDLYDLYTLVLSKKPEKAKEVIKFGTELLTKYKGNKLLNDEIQATLHFRLSNAYQEEGDFPNAIKHQKPFISLALKSKLLTTALGQEEQLAYMLHENQQYSEALKLNLKIEKEATKARLAEDQFFNLYTNIAQNHYKLNDFSSAKIYLDKRLALSQKQLNLEEELDTLFQLGVLAFEDGKFDESEKLFEKRIKLAKTKKHLLKYSTLKGLEEDLKTYHEKLAKKQKWSL